jgi:hypothetical protein
VLPARADPASTLQTLMIVDQGDFLTLQWSFYYVDFPAQFALREKPGTLVTLSDPATLEQNLSEIVSVAFDLKIDGRAVPPDKIARLAVSPNKICTVTMIYRGRPGGQVELSAPVLHYLPPIAMINYEILSLGPSGQVVTGNLMGHAGPFPQVIDYRQTTRTGGPAPALESEALVLFKSQLRTAWINTNWLFLATILLLVRKPAQAVPVLATMAAGWIAVCLLATEARLQVPWSIPEWLLGVATALVGALAAWRPDRWRWIVSAAGGAALLNACHDVPHVRLLPAETAAWETVARCAGFACSLLSVVLVLALILGEGRKFPGFQSKWAPRICWIVAAFALLLPLQRLLVP